MLALPWTTRSGEATPIPDAVFTAASAAAVTGLVTVDTQEHWNLFGQIVILVLIQIGGLGFMVGATIVLRILGRGAGRYFGDSLLVQDGSPTMTLLEAVSVTRRVIRFTFVTEAIGFVLLTVRFSFDEPWSTAAWRGLFTSVSAFCNAGFDLQGNFESMATYRDSVWVNFVGRFCQGASPRRE